MWPIYNIYNISDITYFDNNNNFSESDSIDLLFLRYFTGQFQRDKEDQHKLKGNKAKYYMKM